MKSLLSRRSLLRYSGIGLSGLIAGCSTVSQQPSVPILVDNRDTLSHTVRIEITGTEETFNTQVSVESGSIMKITDVSADNFCLGVDVLELEEGELEDCPSAGDSDFSTGGIAVIIFSGPNEQGQHWVIEPIQNVETTTPTTQNPSENSTTVAASQFIDFRELNTQQQSAFCDGLRGEVSFVPSTSYVDDSEGYDFERLSSVSFD